MVMVSSSRADEDDDLEWDEEDDEWYNNQKLPEVGAGFKPSLKWVKGSHPA